MGGIVELEVHVRLAAVELRVGEPPVRVGRERARERDRVLDEAIERVRTEIARRDGGEAPVYVEVED